VGSPVKFTREDTDMKVLETDTKFEGVADDQYEE
jgi:hypothetical protein